MSPCDEIQELLPWYVNETLAAGERDWIAAHLEACDECAAALVDWRQVAHALPAFGSAPSAVSAPTPTATAQAPGAEGTLPAASPSPEHAPLAAPVRHAPPLRRRVEALVALARVQARLLPSGLWPAIALVLGLGVAIVLSGGWAAHDVLGVLAPVVAAGGVSLACTEENDPRKEIALASPTTARLVLLTRLTLVLAYDFALALAASAVLVLAGHGTLGPLLGVWLAPMLALSGAALLATVVLDPGVAIALAFGLWALRWTAPVHLGAVVLLIVAAGCLALATAVVQNPVDGRRHLG